MRAPFMGGDFPGPVKYGYASVGEVEAGPAELGRSPRVLPVPASDAITSCRRSGASVPAGVPPARAVLAANMETALNAVWDARAGRRSHRRRRRRRGRAAGRLSQRAATGGRGDRGRHRRRRGRAGARLGARFAAPDAPPANPIACSTPAARPMALPPHSARRRGGAIVELSWYGDRAVAAAAGRGIPRRRLRLVARSAGRAVHRPRWSTGRRLALALALLADPVLDVLAPASLLRGAPGAAAGDLASRSADRGLPAHPLR